MNYNGLINKAIENIKIKLSMYGRHTNKEHPMRQTDMHVLLERLVYALQPPDRERPIW